MSGDEWTWGKTPSLGIVGRTGGARRELSSVVLTARTVKPRTGGRERAAYVIVQQPAQGLEEKAWCQTTDRQKGRRAAGETCVQVWNGQEGEGLLVVSTHHSGGG